MTSPLGRQWPRRIDPVDVGFAAPRAPKHDPHAMTTGGEMQPPETKKVVGALFTNAIKPQQVDLSQVKVRATQDRLTRGTLLKHLQSESMRPGRQGSGGDRSTPVMLAHPDGFHYVLDGHHRVASALVRGDSHVTARVLDPTNPQHRQLARQYGHAQEETQAQYGVELDRARNLAFSRGKSLYAPQGQEDRVDHEARAIQQAASQKYHVDHLRNSTRKAQGLPPIKRR